MATYTWSSQALATTDAQFRQAGSELSTALAAVGLVQTADTGQINWSTVTTPATGADAGYEIWRFNDSLQGTAPIFLKVTYGCANNGSTKVMQLKFTLGTASNGTGTVSGTGSSLGAVAICCSTASPSGSVFPSYLSMVGGKLSLAWKVGLQNSGSLIVHRTCDSTGADTATGAIFITGVSGNVSGGSSATVTCINFSTSSISSTAAGYNCLRLGNVSSSLVGTDYQAYLVWHLAPAPTPMIGVVGLIPGEVGSGTTFTATLFGSTSHTYISVPLYQYLSTGLTMGMLWE